MSATVYVTVKQEVNYNLTLSTYIICNAWRMQLAESRGGEKDRTVWKDEGKTLRGGVKSKEDVKSKATAVLPIYTASIHIKTVAWPARMAVTCILYAQQEMARLSGVCCDFSV